MSQSLSTPPVVVNDSLIDKQVYVEYGKCAGMPTLTGIGRITETRFHWGEEWVFVQPVEGLPLPKWVRFSEVQFVPSVQAEEASAA